MRVACLHLGGRRTIRRNVGRDKRRRLSASLSRALARIRPRVRRNVRDGGAIRSPVRTRGVLCARQTPGDTWPASRRDLEGEFLADETPRLARIRPRQYSIPRCRGSATMSHRGETDVAAQQQPSVCRLRKVCTLRRAAKIAPVGRDARTSIGLNGGEVRRGGSY